MRPPTATLGLLLLAAATASAAAGAQGTTGLRGRVDGDPATRSGAIVRATVQVDPALLALEPEIVPEPRTYETRTAPNGRFRLTVPAGSLYRVHATSHDGGRVTAVRHSVHPNEIVRLSLVPASRVRIAEHAATPLGGPLAWHLLGFDRDRREEFLLAHGIAKAAPAALPPLAPGRYRLRGRTEDARAFEAVFQLRPRSEREVPARLVRPATLAVSGPEVRVRLPFPMGWQGRATPGPEIPLPALGRIVAVHVEQPGGRSFDTRVGPLEPGARVALAEPETDARTVAFTVRTGAGEATAGRIVLAWRGAGGTGATRRRSVEFAGSDPVRVPGLPASEMLALCWTRDGGRLAVRVPPEKRREPRSVATVALVTRPGIAAEFTVAGAEGQPLRRAKLFLYPSDLGLARGLEDLFPTLLRYPDRRGRFRFAALPPGDYEARVEAPWHVPQQQGFELAERTTEPLAFRLERGFRVHGRVLAPDGAPAADVLVTMTYPLDVPRTKPLECITGANGEFQFDGVPEGRFILEAARAVGTRSEIGRTRVSPGGEGVVIRLVDEDPIRR